MKCVFCEKPEIKERAVMENDSAFAFLTNIPITAGHTLVAPKRCAPLFSDLTVREKEAVFNLTEKVRSSLIKVFAAEGFNFAWNEGGVGGQSVPHFHLHIVPRKKGDMGITEYDPRRFLYRPGDRKEDSEDNLKKVTDLIRSKLL